MKKPIALLKVAALTTSVILSGGCVAYRGGAFQPLLGPKPNPSGETKDGAGTSAPKLWSGTKSLYTKDLADGLIPAGTPLFPTVTQQPTPEAPAIRTPMSP